MATYEYINRNGGKGFKLLPNDLKLYIMQYSENEFVVTGDDLYNITNKTYKTLKGAMNYIARELPNYELVGEC